MSKDYYDILGVSKSASADEIKTAFRKKAHEYHPDKKGGNEEKFKEANEAYQVLGNTEKRSQYDQFGPNFQHGQAGGGYNPGAGFGGFSGGINMDDLGDIFGGMGDIFGFGGGGSSRGGSRARRGNDLEMVLTVDFMEAVFGIEKEVEYQHILKCRHCSGKGGEPGATTETCKTCNGTGRVVKIQRTILGNMQMESACTACQGEGKIHSKKCTICGGQGVQREKTQIRVKIPAGINTGESIRLAGHGDAGDKGGESGDLYLRIRVKPHDKFIRDGVDIKVKADISIKQAILGDKIEVPTVDGPVKLKIPAGTQSGTIFRLKDSGVVKLHGRGRGDELVEVTVKIPASLNRKNQKLIEELDL
jgi:molecular chaperone DnaJ